MILLSLKNSGQNLNNYILTDNFDIYKDVLKNIRNIYQLHCATGIYFGNEVRL